MVAVAYGALRVALVAHFLERYGVNVAAFAVVELTSSLVFGWSSGRLVQRIVGSGQGRTSALVAAVVISYSAPDVYVLGWSHRYPGNVMATVVIVIASLAVISLVTLWNRTKNVD